MEEGEDDPVTGSESAEGNTAASCAGVRPNTNRGTRLPLLSSFRYV